MLNEQYKDNVTPFQKLLTDKAINDASVKITKDKNQQQLLTWFKDMDTKSKTLYDLAQQINALK